MKLEIERDEIVYDGQFIKLIRRYFRDSDGTEKVWEMVKRKTFGKIVSIAAITPKNELILEKSYRIPLRAYTLELPAGLMDKPGESESDAIIRELLEETGYGIKTAELLLHGPFNSGLSADDLAIYLGRNAEYVQKQELESGEDIEVILVPLPELSSYLENARKEMYADIKITAILPFLERLGFPVK